jgi:hypothetical protein
MGHINQTTVTWLVAGTLPNWQGAPLTLVVALEENTPILVERIGDRLFNASLNK